MSVWTSFDKAYYSLLCLIKTAITFGQECMSTSNLLWRDHHDLHDFRLCGPSRYNDVIMATMASQITSLTIVYLTVSLGTDQRKHQSSASLAFVLGIHRWPVNSPHKGLVTRNIFPFDDVIMMNVIPWLPVDSPQHGPVMLWCFITLAWLTSCWTNTQALWSVMRLMHLNHAGELGHSVVACCSGSLEPECSCHDRDCIMELPMEADILTLTGIFTPEDASVASCCCSGSLEPEYSCHDRDWIMELPMEADILTFTGILTPEDASVASCFPFDITISLSWFPLLSIPPLHSAIS